MSLGSSSWASEVITQRGSGMVDVKPHRITDGELPPDPVVLDKPVLFSADDHVHPEPALIKAALGSKLVQPPEGGRRQDRHREHVEERTDRHGRSNTVLGEQGRAKLLFDNCVSQTGWVQILDVRVIPVDGEVLRRGPGQRDVSPKVHRKGRGRSSPESLVTVAPPGSMICTAASSWPACGGSMYAARQPNMPGNSLTLLALTTLPVAASMSA